MRPHQASSRFVANLTRLFLVVTNALAAIALGFAVCLLFAGFFFFGPRYSAPGLAAALFHLVSVTTMRVPFLGRLTEAHSVLRALTSRVLREVVWLSLLCTMWLVICIVNRDAFVWRLPGMCPPSTPATSTLKACCRPDTRPRDRYNLFAQRDAP